MPWWVKLCGRRSATGGRGATTATGSGSGTDVAGGGSSVGACSVAGGVAGGAGVAANSPAGGVAGGTGVGACSVAIGPGSGVGPGDAEVATGGWAAPVAVGTVLAKTTGSEVDSRVGDTTGAAGTMAAKVGVGGGAGIDWTCSSAQAVRVKKTMPARAMKNREGRGTDKLESSRCGVWHTGVNRLYNDTQFLVESCRWR